MNWEVEFPTPHRTIYIANEKNEQSATLRVRLEGRAPDAESIEHPPPSSPSRSDGSGRRSQTERKPISPDATSE